MSTNPNATTLKLPATLLQAQAQSVADGLVDVLGKSPATTFVVIDEVAMEDWGIGGLPVEEYRAKVRSHG